MSLNDVMRHVFTVLLALATLPTLLHAYLQQPMFWGADTPTEVVSGSGFIANSVPLYMNNASGLPQNKLVSYTLCGAVTASEYVMTVSKEQPGGGFVNETGPACIRDSWNTVYQEATYADVTSSPTDAFSHFTV